MSDYIQLREGLAIYKQKASKNYYVYMRQRDDSDTFVEFRKSTKTDDLNKARETAFFYFFSYEQRITPEIFESNTKSKVLTICKAVLKILDKKTAESDQSRPQSAAHATCIRNQIMPQIPKNLVIKKLNKKLIKSILNQATSATKRRNLTKSIRLLFDYALEEELITSLQIPEISTDEKVKKAEPRKSFSDDDYLKIVGELSKFGEQSGLKPETKIYRFLLMQAFHFLCEVGCRPGREIDNLTYNSIIRDGDGDYVLEFQGTKTDRDSKSRVIVVNEEAVLTVVSIHEYFNPSLYAHLYKTKTTGRLTKDLPTDKQDKLDVFFANRADSQFIFRRVDKQNYCLDWTKYFSQLMTRIELDYTLYSCRHTFITKRLLEGKDINEIALVCGTSIDMIEKYYSDVKPLLVSKAVNSNRKTIKAKPSKPKLNLID
ncbi:site-specific integrase [Vibrio toranzoniae]|uniref:site-specific integrase n=1 Tax=Vibrio toranzoniae TaxID=1194427 RepID=UPI0013777765|nr:site-specific integrase [Vibrio toranzoniae]NAZ92243.1 hypothetical protein [Vibrio toranzoniae]